MSKHKYMSTFFAIRVHPKMPCKYLSVRMSVCLSACLSVILLLIVAHAFRRINVLNFIIAYSVAHCSHFADSVICIVDHQSRMAILSYPVLPCGSNLQEKDLFALTYRLDKFRQCRPIYGRKMFSTRLRPLQALRLPRMLQGPKLHGAV